MDELKANAPQTSLKFRGRSSRHMNIIQVYELTQVQYNMTLTYKVGYIFVKFLQISECFTNL